MAENESSTSGNPTPTKAVGPAHRKKLTFNLKFTLILIAVVGIFGIGVHFLHAYQVDRNAVTLLDKADSALKAGDKSEAIRHLRTYVGFRPQDGEALARLAKLIDENARTSNQLFDAFVTYQEALRFLAEGDEIRRRTAEMAVLMGRYSDALSILKVIRQKDDNDSELALLAARSYTGQKQISEAAREYLLASKYDATKKDAYLGLADIFENFSDSLPVQEDFDENYPQSLVKAFPPQKRDVSETIAQNASIAKQQRIDTIFNEMVRSAQPQYEAFFGKRSLPIEDRSY